MISVTLNIGAILSISGTTRMFPPTIATVFREWREKRKYPVNSSSVDENALLMQDIRGEWLDCFNR